MKRQTIMGFLAVMTLAVGSASCDGLLDSGYVSVGDAGPGYDVGVGISPYWGYNGYSDWYYGYPGWNNSWAGPGYLPAPPPPPRPQRPPVIYPGSTVVNGGAQGVTGRPINGTANWGNTGRPGNMGQGPVQTAPTTRLPSASQSTGGGGRLPWASTGGR